MTQAPKHGGARSVFGAGTDDSAAGRAVGASSVPPEWLTLAVPVLTLLAALAQLAHSVLSRMPARLLYSATSVDEAPAVWRDPGPGRRHVRFTISNPSGISLLWLPGEDLAAEDFRGPLVVLPRPGWRVVGDGHVGGTVKIAAQNLPRGASVGVCVVVEEIPGLPWHRRALRRLADLASYDPIRAPRVDSPKVARVRRSRGPGTLILFSFMPLVAARVLLEVVPSLGAGAVRPVTVALVALAVCAIFLQARAAAALASELRDWIFLVRRRGAALVFPALQRPGLAADLWVLAPIAVACYCRWLHSLAPAAPLLAASWLALATAVAWAAARAAAAWLRS